MRYLRFGSPVTLVGGLVLFTLPWFEISCTNIQEKSVETVQVSGLQLALGGQTKRVNNRFIKSTVIESGGQFEDEKRARARYWMLTYGLATLVGLAVAVAKAPSIARAAIVGFASVIALSMMTLVTVNCLANIGKPPEHQKGIYFDTIFESRFTPWYYASYGVHGLAIALCFLEFQNEKKRVHRIATGE